MADDDASGRFDKQNERGGETSAEGKSTGLFVFYDREERTVGYVRV